MKTLKSVQVPDEFVETAGSPEAAARELTEVAVLDLVRRRVISSGKAAEVLGVSRWDMPDILVKHEVDTVAYSSEELAEERKTYRQVRGGVGVTLVVADAGPIISFARAGQLGLLNALLPELVIPSVVYKEIVIQGGDRPGAREIGAAVDAGGWLRVEDIQDSRYLDQVSLRLDDGERSALALALERGLPVLVDEELGRQEADRLNLRRLSTLLLLERAKTEARIPAIQPVLDRFRATGFRLSQRRYEAFLQDRDEGTR